MNVIILLYKICVFFLLFMIFFSLNIRSIDLNQNLCDVISEKWLNIPMKNAQYTSPLSLMDNLIILLQIKLL